MLDGVELHPRDGSEALAALETVTDRLHRLGDSRSCFADVYAVITGRVLDELASGDCGFIEPDWIFRLMGRFCERYLETLAASLAGRPQDCAAWRIAYVEAGETPPVFDVMLGISAHINYDLALGISQTIRERGTAEQPRMLARYRHDHDHVNLLLRRSMPESMRRLCERHRCPVTRVAWRSAPKLVTQASLAVLGRWRTRVWEDVLELLADEGAQPSIAAVMDRRAERIAGMIGALGRVRYGAAIQVAMSSRISAG